MKKRLIPFAAMAFVGIMATSCGGTTGGDFSNQIFTLSYNLSDPNMSGLWKPGLEEASVAEGYEKISVFDAKNDDSEAVKMTETAGTQNYAGYLINVVDQTNGASYLNKLKDTGKPVVFWNREVDKSVVTSYDKAYYVGIESAEGGRYQGQMAAEYVNKVGFDKIDRNKDGKLGVIVVRGEKGHADAEARTLYSPMYLERNLQGGNASADGSVSGNTYTAKGTWNKVEVKSIVDGTDTAGTTWDPVTAASEVARVLNDDSSKSIDLVLSNNDGMALGIITNSTFKNSGIPIWGVDALSDALAEIKKEGTQFMGTVQNDGRTQAKVCVKAVKNLSEDKAITDGMNVVDTKEAWEKDPTSYWYDKEYKAIRVHHAKITAENA